jgi:hypothetical protein
MVVQLPTLHNSCDAKEHYPTHDLELLVVVHVLKVWRHYLLDNLVGIYIDHKSLKHLLTQPNLNMSQ